MPFAHRTDNAGLSAEFMRTHGGYHLLNVFRRDDRGQLAFIRDIQRIQPQQFTCAPDFIPNGDCPLLNLDTDLSLLCDLIQSAGQPAASWVAHAPDLRGRAEHSRHQFMKRSRITFDFGIEFQTFSLRQNGDAMIPKGTAENHPVSRTRLACRKESAIRYKSDSRRV